MLAQVLISSMMAGAVYALVALGFVLTFGAYASRSSTDVAAPHSSLKPQL